MLDAAQALYDQHLTSHPRTDSRHITQDIADTVANRLKGLEALPTYAEIVEPMPRPLAMGRLAWTTVVKEDLTGQMREHEEALCARVARLWRATCHPIILADRGFATARRRQIKTRVGETG